MRFVGINYLKEGDVVYENVYDSQKHLLIRTGEVLNDLYIKRLKQFGFNGLYIEDEITKDIYVEDLIPSELRYKTITNLKNLNIQDTIDNAKEIVENILAQKNIVNNYIDFRTNDNELFQHSISVTETSVIMGAALKLNNNQLLDLAVAALLHDIGKIFKDPKMIKKIKNKGDIEIDEYNEKSHPYYAFLFLKNDSSIDIKAMTNKVILTHHINEDKTGTTGIEKYDKMVKDIPLYSKIIHVADEYDIKRNETGKPSEAAEYLKGGSGSLFEPTLVKLFLNFVAIYPIGTTVTLSNGLKGVVSAQNKGIPERPKVVLENGQEIDLMNRSNLNITVTGNDYSNDYGQETEYKSNKTR